METLQLGKLKIKIQQDDYPLNPREEFENVGTIACWHRRYNLGDVQPGVSPDEYLLELMQQREYSLHKKYVPDDIEPEHVKAYINKHYFILPIYMYDHSGISLNTTPFSCPWDSGQLGFIYASRDCKDYTDLLRLLAGIEAEGSIYSQYLNGEVYMLAGLEAEVRIYNQYLNGEVYGFEIIDENGDVVDGCWGFYGLKACKTEAMHIAQAYV